MPRKLRVRREGFTMHRNGKVIRVRPTTFMIKDRGAPGRGRKVVKIKRKGLLNNSAHRRFGKDYTDLNASQRHSILRGLKRRGYSERQLLGMMQSQYVFRKRMRDVGKSIFEADRTWIAKALFPTN